MGDERPLEDEGSSKSSVIEDAEGFESLYERWGGRYKVNK